MRTAYQDRIKDLLDQSKDPELLEPLSPTGGPLAPEMRRPKHPDGCLCIECWNAGLRYGEYLKQKGLNEL